MNEVHFWQYGTDNLIEGYYTKEFLAEGDNSLINIQQWGTDNHTKGAVHNMSGEVDIYQDGTDNFTLVHIGDRLLWGNMVDVDQMGMSNNAFVKQTTGGNSATVYQNGNSNSSTVMQH